MNFMPETNLIFQNISKSLETEAFLYLSRYGNLLKTFKLHHRLYRWFTVNCTTNFTFRSCSIKFLATSTFLKEIDLFIDKDPFFSDRHRSISLGIPCFVTSLKWFSSYKPGLSDQQLRKITKNYTLLEIAKLSLGVNVSENTLKAFFKSLTILSLICISKVLISFEKSTFQDLEFSQLKRVHLQIQHSKMVPIDALQAPHLKTLHLTFSQGNPVTQKLDQLKALNITCPYEHVDQILHNCLNIKSLEIALNAYKYIKPRSSKNYFF